MLTSLVRNCVQSLRGDEFQPGSKEQTGIPSSCDSMQNFQGFGVPFRGGNSGNPIGDQPGRPRLEDHILYLLLVQGRAGRIWDFCCLAIPIFFGSRVFFCELRRLRFADGEEPTLQWVSKDSALGWRSGSVMSEQRTVHLLVP